MRAKDVIMGLHEKKGPAPYWTHTRGVYADLSDYPNSVDYYAKCPECGFVHGNYRTLKEVKSKRLCPGCDAKSVQKIKKKIAKLREADESDFSKFNVKSLVQRTVDWRAKALIELEMFVDEKLDVPEDMDDGGMRVESADSDHQWVVYRTYADAENAAVSSIEDVFESDPETLSDELAKKSDGINEEKLRNILRADEVSFRLSDFNDEHNTFESARDELIEAGKLEREDFFELDEAGNEVEKPETPLLLQKVENAKELHVEALVDDALSDPVDYLIDIYGEKEAMKLIKKWDCIDYKKAAEYVVRSDGPANELARYDGKEIKLRDAYAYRTG